jgi:hypothetical protein
LNEASSPTERRGSFWGWLPLSLYRDHEADDFIPNASNKINSPLGVCVFLIYGLYLFLFSDNL